MQWTCAKCEGWEGSCWEVIFKVGLQNTTGSSGGCGVYLKSSTKEIIPAPYSLRLSLRIQNSLQLFITIKKRNYETLVALFLLLCPTLSSSPSFCAAGHVSRKLLGFQRITGLSCGETFHEDLSNCLYVGTHTKNSFTNRKYHQCSSEFFSICKSVSEFKLMFVRRIFVLCTLENSNLREYS